MKLAHGWPRDLKLPSQWLEETNQPLRLPLNVLVYRLSAVDQEKEGPCRRERYDADLTLPEGLLESLCREAGWPRQTVLIRAYFKGESNKDVLNKRFAAALPAVDPTERFFQTIFNHQDEVFNVFGGFLKYFNQFDVVIDGVGKRIGKSIAQGVKEELDL